MIYAYAGRESTIILAESHYYSGVNTSSDCFDRRSDRPRLSRHRESRLRGSRARIVYGTGGPELLSIRSPALLGRLTRLLTYVYRTSAAEAEDQQVEDEARLQVVHCSVDGPRARGHRTLITAPAKIKFQKGDQTRTRVQRDVMRAEESD